MSWRGLKIPIIISTLVGVGFLFRAYPHLTLITRWIIEEQYNYQTVRDLVIWGSSPQAGFYPMLEHQLIYWTWLLTHINPVTLSQYANPLLGALTVVPLYYVLRHRLTVNQSLLGCGLWALSEAAFYRSAYFGSTEALGFLLSLSALALYQRKHYIPTATLLILGALSHLLPTAFIFGVVFADLLLKATTRQKLLIIGAGLGVLTIFFSPLNPHQRLLSSLNVGNIVDGFGTFNLYSAAELLGGAAIFAGFIALGIAAAWGWLRTRKSRLMTIYLGLAALIFAFSWVDYQPNIFAPPRLTFYFLVPLIYYASTWVNVKTVGLICVVSVVASLAGCPTMLMTDKALPKEEYLALEEMSALGIIGNPGWWLADYPVKTTIGLYATKFSLWEVPFNGTAVVNASEKINKTLTGEIELVNGSPPFVYPYQYIYLSERMERGAFIMINTDGRSRQIIQPIRDIWTGTPLWKLVYEGHGVKVYHYEGKI